MVAVLYPEFHQTQPSCNSLKPRSDSRLVPVAFTAAIAIAFSFIPQASAATVTWDIAAGDAVVTGGTGTWDTTLINWTTNSEVSDIAWNNTTNDLAVFCVISETVTISNAITANALTFNSTSYTDAGGTLTLAGATPTITVGTTPAATPGCDPLPKIISGTLIKDWYDRLNHSTAVPQAEHDPS